MEWLIDIIAWCLFNTANIEACNIFHETGYDGTIVSPRVREIVK